MPQGPSVQDLQNQLDEINRQLFEMTGSPSFSISGFSVDEFKLQDQLMEQKTSLEWRIANCTNNPSASTASNMGAIQSRGAY
jgi:hypothetical protein